MPSKSDLLADELRTLADDLRQVLVTLRTDPKEQRNKELQWRLLYGGPFRHLGSLARGDRIVVTTGQGESTYRVNGVASVGATHGSVFGDYGDNRLTLFTADPPLRASRRLVVTAKLVGRPFAATELRRTLDAEGLSHHIRLVDRASGPELLDPKRTRALRDTIFAVAYGQITLNITRDEAHIGTVHGMC